MMQTAGKAKNQLTGRQKKKIRLVLLLLPFMIFVLIFNYAPLLGWSYAFVDFKPGVSVFDSEFVGLKYFQKIVANPKDFLPEYLLLCASRHFCHRHFPAEK